MATIRKRGNSYQISVYLGTDSNGDEIKKYTTWTPQKGLSEKEIDKELKDFVSKFESFTKCEYLVDPTITFEEYSNLWIQRGEENGERPLSPKTLERYKYLLIRTNKALGFIKISEMQPLHIRRFLQELRKEGIREDFTFVSKIDLRSLMKQRNITQQNLSDLSHISLTTIRSMLKGNEIIEATAEAVCNVLDLKISIAFIKINKETTLSNRTILHYFRLISAILTSAVVDDMIISSNPAKRVRAPQVKQKEAPYLDEIQAIRMIELLDNEPFFYKTMVLLLLFTGMRRGELCGLEWKDIDFTHQTLTIRRTSQYTKEKGVYTTCTKTLSSYRTIKISETVINILKEYQNWQLKQKRIAGDLWIDSDRLYTTWNGEPAHPDSITSWFEDFIKRTDLPNIHIHSLRHTNATLLIAGGEDIRTVSRRLGHSQVTTTVNTYTHAIQSADAKAAHVIDNILHPIHE